MKDIALLLFLIFFWFIFIVIVTNIASDPLLGISTNENGTMDGFAITNESQFLNTSGLPDTENILVPTSGLKMIVKLFVFRLPTLGFPVIIGHLLSFINFVLVLLAALLLYRAVRHGGG